MGSYLPLILICLYQVLPFGLFTTVAFLEGLPPGLREVAVLEGASGGQYLVRVLVPLCAPVTGTAAVAAFPGSWNGFLAPLLFLTDDRRYTVALALHTLVGSVGSAGPRWGRFAALSLVNCLVLAGVLAASRGPVRLTRLGEVEP